MKKILLTGGSGKLGRQILRCNNTCSILSPNKELLDITNSKSVSSYFQSTDFEVIIHCAAMARMSECEKTPKKASDINILGTYNLVSSALQKEKEIGKRIRFIYISTDGVYECQDGDYSETSPTKPYNFYGKTKLAAEGISRTIEDHTIIRTRFFDQFDIPFKDAATDIVTSSIEINELSKAIIQLINKDFKGTINIGSNAQSEYERYSRYKADIRPCKRKDIVKNLDFEIAKNASMNISLFKEIF